MEIEATPSDDLRRYKLAIDRKRVRMGANNKGRFEVRGDCNDGSEHRLSYGLVGPAGATLSIKVLCGGETEVEIANIEIFPEGEPYAAGWQDFRL
ncbi:MAG TPA: hypothetical protein VF759_14130 [Allosphingosinicella sp.]